MLTTHCKTSSFLAFVLLCRTPAQKDSPPLQPPLALRLRLVNDSKEAL